MFTSRRRRARTGHDATPSETLETRTLLTSTAGHTIAEILNLQADDSGRIQTLIDTGRVNQNSGTNLNNRLLKALELTRRGNATGAAVKLDEFEALAEKLVGNGRLSRKDADDLIQQGLTDRNGGDYDILRQAVQDTGLGPTLNRFRADYTVFAPTDNAFISLAQQLGGDGRNEAEAYDEVLDALGDFAGGDPIPVLADVLEYHLLRDELTFRDVVTSDEITTFGGEELIPSGRFLQDVDTDLADAKLNKGRSDIPAKNGTIHTVNQVLMPIDLVIGETITELVSARAGAFDGNQSDFDVLGQALAATGLDDTLDDDSLSVTAFAPIDRAFIDFAREFGLTDEPEDQADTRSLEERAFDLIMETFADLNGGDAVGLLTDVLQYHVAPGSWTVNQVVQGGTFATLLGPTITPQGRTLRDQDPEIADANILKNRSDVPAENGSLHTIDGLLLPMDFATTDTFVDWLDASGDGFDSNKADHDILAQAVADAGLTDTLDDPSADLTVFAPTDNAFIIFARSLGYEGVDEQGAYGTIIDTLADLGGGDATPLLREILLYHAVAGTRTVAQLRASATVTTLQGNTLDIRPRRLVDNNSSTQSGTFSSARTNQVVENGMAHVISRLLLPFELN